MFKQKFIKKHISFKMFGAITLIIIALSSFNAQGQFLLVYGKIKAKYGDLTGVKMLLYENNKLLETYYPQKSGKFEVELDYDSKFKMSFIKDGYVGKDLEFDTKVPLEFANVKLGPIEFAVDIYPMAENLNLEVFKNPVGKIKFDRSINNFDYDKDYSKTIEAKINDVEKKIDESYKDLATDEVAKVINEFKEAARERRKEEEQQQELANQQKLDIMAQNKADAEKRKKEEEERQASEQARVLAENKAKADELRKQAEEEERRKAEEEANRLAALKAQAEAIKKAEEEKRVQDSIANANRLAEIKRQNEERKKEEEKIKAEQEAARLAKMKEEQELARKKAEEEKRREDEKKAQLLAEAKAKSDSLRKQAEEEERKKAEEEAARLAKIKANAEALRKAEEERKIAEEAERLAKIKAEEDLLRKKAEEEKRIQAEKEAKLLADAKVKADELRRLAEEEEKRKAEDEAARLAKLKEQTELIKKAEQEKLRKEQEEREANIAQMKAEAEARKIAREKAMQEEKQRILDMMAKEFESMKKTEFEKRQSVKREFLISLDAALNSFINDFDKQYPNGKTVEVYEQDTWTITKVIMKDNIKAIQYLQVQHHLWGGTFYFKREEVQRQPAYNCISQAIFDIETNENSLTSM